MAKSSMIRNISIVSSMTIVSRIFGYLRDRATVRFFGTSEIFGAFILAFSLPNLFRRLLGEGALSSAVVPMLSSQYVSHGRESMFNLFNLIIRRLVTILFCILAVIYVVILITSNIITVLAAKDVIIGEKWTMVLSFTSALLPYMAFVCLSAMCAAVLNILGKFFIASINQIWMNISMILSLLIGRLCYNFDGIKLMHCLIAGVLIGGILQLIISLCALVAIGWRPTSSSGCHDMEENMRMTWKLFLPGAFGAAIEQLNILISRGIAYTFSPSVVASLYIAVRITELPTGIFGAAITTVFFPSIAKSASSDASASAIGKTFSGCLVAMAWILLPSAVGLFILRHEIISVLFEYGDFSSKDVLSVVPLVTAYCVSMVFSGTSALLIRGFHSLKNTKTPALVGVIVLVSNAFLALTLVGPFGATGLAMATASTAILQCILLLILFKRTASIPISFGLSNCTTIVRGCVTVAAIAFAAKFFVNFIKNYLPLVLRHSDITAIALSIALAIPAYLLICRKFIANVIRPAAGKS
ncbi:MAG: murein biosynthesis integral membrane protein MurJ [Puniceicoccales bacterium]|jgi:putative peptidoglycan lipid II flippase|nr:murein biosynthesis integral membrane protein MurJ [Puniceicoccales bacterium]